MTKYVCKKMNDAIQNAVDSIMLDELIDESRQNSEAGAGRGALVCEQKAGIKA